jgi:hypothetical protein
MTSPRGLCAMLASVAIALAALSAAAPPGYAAGPDTWPPSAGALISEVATGGASASDEFVELYNAGPSTLELGGDELIYVTASGATVTRKAAFATPTPLGPGQHLLVANSAGGYAAAADATYSGGLAADGGTVALRRADGGIVDAVSWGSAQNAYAEGAPAPAPPAGSSLERLPGYPLGNWIDGNDNSADWQVRATPAPQSLASGAEPAPPVEPTTEPTPAPTPERTIDATPGATTEPTPERTIDATPGSSTGTTPQPSPQGPTPDSSAGPSVGPSPGSAAPSPAGTLPTEGAEPIALARSRPVGSRVRVAGIATISPGLTGSSVLFAISDSTAGIFVRLPATATVLAGQPVEVAGTLAAPYGQLEIRELEALTLGNAGPEPEPLPATVGQIGEGLEAWLVSITGQIVSVQTEDGRLTLEVADGGASLRVVADPATGLSAADVARGQLVRAVGVVGQHATASGALDGYKLWLRGRADLAILPAPSPSGPAATPGSAATPAAASVYTDLASGLAARGRVVDVVATVTAGVGLVDWGGPTVVVDDGTAAVAVVLPAAAPSPRAGERIRVVGKVGSLHGGPRVVATLVERLSAGQSPEPQRLSRSLRAGDEWRLVSVLGRVERLTKAGVRWRADLRVAGHAVAILGEPAAGVSASGMLVGRLVLVAGIVRRSLSDSSTFYVLPRSPADVWLGPAPAQWTAAPAQAAMGADGASGHATAHLVAIADLASAIGREVVVAGLVTDAAGGEATLDDGTGQVRLGGAAAAEALSLLEPGDAIEVTGTVSRDSAGLLLLVDPDRILAVSGGAAAGDDGSGGPAAGATIPASAPPSPGPGRGAAALATAAGRPGDPLATLALAAAGVAILAAVVLAAGSLLALANPGLRRRARQTSGRAWRSLRRPGEGRR